MPFKSKAQRRKFAELLVTGKISPETYEEWNRETGGKILPERVKKKKQGEETHVQETHDRETHDQEGEEGPQTGATMIYIGLLRAINLGAYNKIAMADLRRLLVDLGFEDPKTLLLSGNVVFGAPAQPAAKLEKLLQDATAKHLGVTTDYFVRTAKEWSASVAANPFPAEAKRDPGRMVMMCLKDAPPPAAVKALQAAIRGREVVKARGAQAYVVYPDGMGRSKLTIAVIERVLGTRGTARNWNTVTKLAVLAES